MLDTADIVRDRDFTSTNEQPRCLMVRMARFILALTVLVAFVASAQQPEVPTRITAGSEEPLVSKVENAIRSTEPGWQYTPAILNGPPPLVPSERLIVAGEWNHHLKSGSRESVEVNLFRVDSSVDAEMSLSEVREGAVATGWRVQRFQIGDEGYLSTFKNGARFGLHFRKGTIIVRLSGNSFRLVKKFAHCIAAQIETT